MKQRKTKEKYMEDCKVIGDKIQNIKDLIGYYPTYRELGIKLKTTYTTAYNQVQEAIWMGWITGEIKAHYSRKVK